MASLRMVVLGCALVGCGPVVAGGEDGGDGDESTGGDATRGDTMTTVATMATSATTGATSVSTSDPSTTATATATDATVTTTDPSASATATFTTTADPSATDSETDGHGDLPNGSMCADDFECASDRCYVIPILGGICGECNSDADCPDGGCTLPNFLAQPPTPSVCNDGSYGGGCESHDVCDDGLLCATTVDVPGVVTVSTCSECETDMDCDPGLLCAPDIALAAFTGVKRCVASGTLANGQSCDFASSGDASCASGHCAVADIMGLLLLGVCSSCESDMDCASQVCEPPQADLNTGVLIPGACG